jgi:dUTP pyrophosphatase
LYNSSEQQLTINKGDRIAQILFQEIPRLRLVKSDTLSDTDRGEGGFGSSGR